MLKLFFLALLVLFTSSCISMVDKESMSDTLPRKGYVFVHRTINYKSCKPGPPVTTKEKGKKVVKSTTICEHGQSMSVGSGFVVDKFYKGSYIMTAAHVCLEQTVPKHITIKENKLKVQALMDTRYYKAQLIGYDHDIDACILFVEDLTHDIEIVKMADEPPVPGDKVYNIASPYGIHAVDMVPIFEGRHVGTGSVKSYYTFTAAGGSSGSMILNADGELIGLLHSVYIHLGEVAVGVEYYSLKQFMERNLIDHRKVLNQREGALELNPDPFALGPY